MIYYKFLDENFIISIKSNIFNTLIIPNYEDITYGDLVQFHDKSRCIVVVGACRCYDDLCTCINVENNRIINNNYSDGIRRNLIGSLNDISNGIIALDIIEI